MSVRSYSSNGHSYELKTAIDVSNAQMTELTGGRATVPSNAPASIEEIALELSKLSISSSEQRNSNGTANSDNGYGSNNNSSSSSQEIVPSSTSSLTNRTNTAPFRVVFTQVNVATTTATQTKTMIIQSSTDESESYEELQRGYPDIHLNNFMQPAAFTTDCGKWGEAMAYSVYLPKKFPIEDGYTIQWVNESGEQGKPYDCVVKRNKEIIYFVEVKSSAKSKLSDTQFIISRNQWEFAGQHKDKHMVLLVLGFHDYLSRKTLPNVYYCSHLQDPSYVKVHGHIVSFYGN